MNSERGKAYLVGGVNGVGKSSLTQELSVRYPEFEVFRGSTRFMEWLRLPPGDYEVLQKLPEDYKSAELEKMMAEVFKNGVSGGKTLIIDAHYFNYKHGELIDATGGWVSQLDALFVVSVSPATILRRIELDQVTGGRKRDVLPHNISRTQKIELLGKFLRVTVDKAQDLSKKYSVPYFVINNDTDGLNIAIGEFLECHSALNSD